MDSFTWNGIQRCCNDLREVVLACLKENSISFTSVAVCKRNRELKDGDIIIPLGLITCISEEGKQALKDELTQKFAEHRWKLHRITSPSYCFLAFHFDRQTLYKDILTALWTSDVLTTGRHYMNKGQIVLYPGLHTSNTPSTDDLRGFILLQHIANLLKCSGYDVSFQPVVFKEDRETLLQKIGLDPCQMCSADNLPEYSFTVMVEKYNLQRCRYLVYKDITHTCSGIPINHKIKPSCLTAKDFQVCNCSSSQVTLDSYTSNNRGDISSGDTSTCVPLTECNNIDVSVDFKLFIEESNIKTGKGFFEKSMKTVASVSNRNGTCTDIMREVLQLQNTAEQIGGNCIVVHLNSEKRFFHQQKVDLLWKVLFGEQNFQQVHINYGLVTSRQGTSAQKCLSAEEFIGTRFQQMKDASVMKYGDKVAGANWEETISSLTLASLKFEFLMTNHRNTVKLDLSEVQEFGGGVDNRAGSFVMYNCARLSTLFKHYEENVLKGVYPPLPDINCIDFSTLREEDEWELFYNYIFTYTDLIIETTGQFIPDDSIISKIQTHKVCNFLVSLSRQLSSYYSRTHVLGENRPHLLPTMHGRLYLLKVIHKIMCHGLNLMGIIPLNQL